jgi:4-hydroxy-tetrahydrodipicolinate reductase
MTNIGIIGSAGRMGQALAQAITETGNKVAGGVDRDGDVMALAQISEALVDFSTPGALEANIDAAVANGIPMLIGTTPLEERHHWMIDEASRHIPIIQTGNTSLGVTLLAALVRQTAARLGPDWDIEILEMHHRMKIDAPSGTAMLLGEAAAAGRGISLENHSERGRDGMIGARERGAIGFASLRGGSVAGDHSVFFAGEYERLIFTHVAENRGVFARGAVRGVLWLLNQKKGRYTMEDVLDIRP